MYYVYLHFYICILHIHVNIFIIVGFLGTNNADFAKSFIEGHICSSSNTCSEEMLDALSELVTLSSFIVCSVLSCFAPQLKLQYKVCWLYIIVIYDAGFGSYGTIFWQEITTLKIQFIFPLNFSASFSA